jgi:hypothetical protein
MRRLIVLALLVSACGGSDSSGPSDPPAPLNVAGSWNATWANMNGGGSSCFVTGGQLNISQSVANFTGTYTVQHFVCDGFDFGATSGTIVNGTLNGNAVGFDLDNQALHQTGTVSGNSMSGSAIWTTSVQGVTITLNGTWSASR